MKNDDRLYIIKNINKIVQTIRHFVIDLFVIIITITYRYGKEIKCMNLSYYV